MKAGRSNIKAKVGRKKDYEKKGGQKIRRNLGGKGERKKKSLLLALNWSG